MRIEKVHQGATYERTFEGVARKLERLHVDKGRGPPRAGKETYRRFVHRAGVPLNATARLDRVPEELVARNHYEPIRDVVTTLVARIRGTLRHLIDIGVGYLSLNRGVPTLSRGESQRVKMAGSSTATSSIFIYILDEPAVGLHPRNIDLNHCPPAIPLPRFVRAPTPGGAPSRGGFMGCGGWAQSHA